MSKPTTDSADTPQVPAVADRILAHRAGHCRHQTRERPPEGGAPAAWAKRIAQLGPGDAGLDRHDGVGLVDVDALEPRRVDGDAAGRDMDIALGVAGAAAAHLDGCARRRTGGNDRLELLDRCRPGDRQRGLVVCEDVG
jgi:hypothetical protein